MEARSKRVQRVESELFATLSRFLLHGMPQVLPCYAAISAVEVQPDLRNAKVFFRLVGATEVTREAQAVLDQERVNFQREVARTLNTKFCPVLRFEYGVAPEADPIDALLEGLRRPKFFGE